MASINITWSNIPTDSLSQQVQYKESSSSTWITFATLSATDTSAVITGVAYDTLYDVRIVNVCNYGTTHSNIQKAIKTTCPLITTTTTEDTINYSFPGTNKGVLSYTLQLINSSNQLVNDQVKTPTNGTITGSFTALSPGTAYTIRILVKSLSGTNICPGVELSTSVEASIPCGTAASYSGGEAFPSENIITLGSGTGTVTLTYDAVNIPDKFIVLVDGVVVINTGYRGDIFQQSALNSALNDRGLPDETIVGGGSGTATFNKTSSTSTAVVRVYAPIGGTAWSFTLSCPDGIAPDPGTGNGQVETMISNIDLDTISFTQRAARSYAYNVMTTSIDSGSIYGNHTLSATGGPYADAPVGGVQVVDNYPVNNTYAGRVNFSASVIPGSGAASQENPGSIYATLFASDVNIKKLFTDNPSLTEVKFKFNQTKQTGAAFTRTGSFYYANNATVNGKGRLETDGGTYATNTITTIQFDQQVEINCRVEKVSTGIYNIYYYYTTS